MSEGPYTSYGLKWRRADDAPWPDFRTVGRSMEYIDVATGRVLFTVQTAPGFPSDGILTLIAEAPRLRDELESIVSGTSA